MEENRNIGKAIVDIVLMVIAFVVIQLVVESATFLVYGTVNHVNTAALMQQVAEGKLGELIACTTVMSSLITIMVYPRLKWSPIDRTYLRSRPWGTLLWAAILTLGTILPFEWVYEQLQIQMSDSSQALFESVMREPWGYVALGVLAPVAEELVFRGGVLRVLLSLFGKKSHWAAIVLSAIVFGGIHMNVAQGVHGFVMGLLLGWLYYRTGSLAPGIIVHWVNNSVAYFVFVAMPYMADGKLIDLFHGNERTMWLGLLCSVCIFVPALLQVALRTKKR